MAYTPIGWQTGDTITAEKLNKMDNGWSVETNSQVFFDGNVTTAEAGGYGVEFDAITRFDSDTITVIFNGVEYDCPNNGSVKYPEYGALFSSDSEAFDFTTFPFNISAVEKTGTTYYITTENAGTYMLKIEIVETTTETSNDFQVAVNKAADSPIFWCESGTTTYSEMREAQIVGKLLVFKYFGAVYLVSSFEYIQGDENTNYVTCAPVFDDNNQTLKFDSNGALSVFYS